LTRAHEGRAALSAVDSAICWGRLLAAVPSGRRRRFHGVRAFGAIDQAAAAAPAASYRVIANVRL
jgi:hypothetical protein